MDFTSGPILSLHRTQRVGRGTQNIVLPSTEAGAEVGGGQPQRAEPSTAQGCGWCAHARLRGLGIELSTSAQHWRLRMVAASVVRKQQMGRKVAPRSLGGHLFSLWLRTASQGGKGGSCCRDMTRKTLFLFSKALSNRGQRRFG